MVDHYMYTGFGHHTTSIEIASVYMKRKTLTGICNFGPFCTYYEHVALHVTLHITITISNELEARPTAGITIYKWLIGM